LVLSALIAFSPRPLVNWFLTPDQQAQRHFDQGEFAVAAAMYSDPLRAGVAWYQAGEFEQAARESVRSGTAEGFYNAGNAQVLLGKYEAAIAAYEQALMLRPDWEPAENNRLIAMVRAERTKAEGGEEGTGGMLEADEYVFDLDASKGGQNQAVEGGESSPESMSDQQIQAMWLRRVQTRPADFMAARFAYQLAAQDETE
jgi:Ca-activated chloride channel family protein